MKYVSTYAMGALDVDEIHSRKVVYIDAQSLSHVALVKLCPKDNLYSSGVLV